MTSLACIIGWPLAGSLSPAMHNAAFAALELDWTYVPIAVQPGAIDEGVGLLRTLGVDGANVTIPHKIAIIPFLDAIRGDAKRFGAVNTILREGDDLVGENTDGAGFIRFLRVDAGFDPSGAHAVILGAGGAARAVALALAREGARVTVIARKSRQAEALAGDGIAAGDWAAPPSCDLVINATPSRDELPLPPARVAVDLIYLAPETGFLRQARLAGARTYDGLGMLVHQAVLSFQMWTGREPPAEVMREAAQRALHAETDESPHNGIT